MALDGYGRAGLTFPAEQTTSLYLYEAASSGPVEMRALRCPLGSVKRTWEWLESLRKTLSVKPSVPNLSLTSVTNSLPVAHLAT